MLTPNALLKIVLLLMIAVEFAPLEATPAPAAPVSLIVQRSRLTLDATTALVTSTPLFVFPDITQSVRTALVALSARNPKRLVFRLQLLMFTTQPPAAGRAFTAPPRQCWMIVFLIF